MYYYMMFSPLTWGLLLAAMLGLVWNRLGRTLRILALGFGALVLLLCTPLGANALVRYAEARTPAPARCGPGAAHAVPPPLVLLAGGFEREPTATDDYAALSAESWRRLRSAVDLWRGNPYGVLVIAGGGPFPVKESAMLARLAQDWGVPRASVRIETRSTTTWESAMALREVLPSQVRLISSALHLPRALIAFRAAGINACAESGDSLYQAPEGWGYLVPQTSAIEKAEAAVYEIVGTLDYRIRQSQAPVRGRRQ